MDMPEAPRAYAVSDVHGHLDRLEALLRHAGLTDHHGSWSGGDSTLWFLGDYVDRGPDSLDVVDFVRGLQAEAAAAGGRVGALLGNHEVQFLAAHRFRDQPVAALAPYRDWHTGWLAFGGRQRDLDNVRPDQLQWLSALPALAQHGDTLLMHSDTDRYLDLGRTLADVNAAVLRTLAVDHLGSWVNLAAVISSRGAFVADSANDADARLGRVLRAFGGRRIVHGHSTLGGHFGLAPEQTRRPHVYAGGRVTAIDGGVFADGELLLAALRAPVRAPTRATVRRRARSAGTAPTSPPGSTPADPRCAARGDAG